jgi:hypothetical protein
MKGDMMRRQIWTNTFLLVTVALAGLLAFSCTSTEEVPRMTQDELKGMLASKALILIDVRAGKDWDKSEMKIMGAVREDPKDFNSWYAKYPKSKTLVLYCS